MAEESAVLLFPAPKDPTKIGAIECDVLIEQEITLSSEVTEHPVEDGFPVHDHVIRRPVKLAMTIAISNMPVTWYDRFGGNNPDRMSDAISKLEEIYKAGDPITIATSEKIYENMVMTDCRIPKNRENGKILRVPLEFTQIRKVQVKTVYLSPELVDILIKGMVGETKLDAGAAKTEDIGTGASGDTANNGGGGNAGEQGKSSSVAVNARNVLRGILG